MTDSDDDRTRRQGIKHEEESDEWTNAPLWMSACQKRSSGGCRTNLDGGHMWNKSGSLQRAKKLLPENVWRHRMVSKLVHWLHIRLQNSRTLTPYNKLQHLPIIHKYWTGAEQRQRQCARCTQITLGVSWLDNPWKDDWLYCCPLPKAAALTALLKL